MKTEEALLTNTQILQSIIDKYPFDFHEAKDNKINMTGYDYIDQNDPFSEKIVDYLNNSKFSPFIWNLQRAKGIGWDALNEGTYQFKTQLNEIVTFRVVFQTLLFDIE